ncbi:tRNA dimethylallyltransferase MiaA [Gottschalkia purinilytica]|uniref:tRNA dimethylallyltransferase n=1 Tax=Gottschalkia purinilytica TaxID=1503 RepID=A0A0L0WBQ9_GOTPU|nr:tRNA (adenosine(37)-N6)-dimethylallyltransferase MiaA [Gottschalkia purinilytica]KNF08921.1 tRNA dimethylallyltransferase MiaA [Gottschalkia purinilytica]
MDKKSIFLLVGPTAIGKTGLSIELAKKLNGEIISADSIQIYKYMDIGTAKITEEEKEGISHYMIDEVFPDQEFSVSDFQKRAYEYIDTITSKNKLPIIVGGTGLYTNSIIYDLDFTKAISNWDLREKYLKEVEIYGNEYIYEKLKKIDPSSAERLHINDTKRIIRALEIYHETGKPMSHFYKDFRAPNKKFHIAKIGLTMDRQKLYSRINQRVDNMIDNGLIEEVEKLLNMGYSENLTSMKGLGYKEIVKYLKGEYSLDEAIEILKRDTRRYAKRQLTWFRRDGGINWVNIDEFDNRDNLVQYIVNYVKEYLKISRI